MTTLSPPAALRLSPLAALRGTFASHHLDGYVVPRTDEYQGEYVASSSERLAWVTGFTGSAGTAVILAEQAWLFTDGRYTLQAAAEVADQPIEVRLTSDKPMHEALADLLPRGVRLGYDPWLHTPDQVGHLQRASERARAELVPVQFNLVDQVWHDRPAPPSSPVVVHPLDFAGQDWHDKVTLLSSVLATDAVVLTDPSSVAWLLNVRGGDVPYTPLPLGRAILYAEGPRVDVFMDPVKIGTALRAAFPDCVDFKAPQDLAQAVEALSGKKVQVDYAQAPQALVSALELAGAKVVNGTDPCVAPRAQKNQVELAGARAAHVRDGVAMARFLAWLAEQSSPIDELGVAETVEAFRAQGQYFKDLSFPTIAGFGPNGAIVHYRSSPSTNRRLEMGGLLLLDSGAQYLDGTTDITRTVAIGPVGDEEKRRFTQVLKGHIAVSRAVFPPGTSGSQLDALARLALWADGGGFRSRHRPWRGQLFVGA